MSENRYRLYCDYCHYNRLTDGTDLQGMVIVKRSAIQTSLPKQDSSGKTVPSKFGNLINRVKCPKCGRVIRPRKLGNEQDNIKGN